MSFLNTANYLSTLSDKRKLHIREDSIQVVTPPRRVTKALIYRLKSKLEKKVKGKMVRHELKLTDWVNQIVIIVKLKGKLENYGSV